MAKRKRTRRDSNTPQGSWLDHLAFDPAEHPDARAISGFLKTTNASKTNAPKTVVLYLNLDLNTFLEVQTKDILDQKTMGEEPARTVLWLKGTAVIREVMVARIDDQARFLSGRLADQYLQQAASRSWPIDWPQGTTTNQESRVFGCFTNSIRCG
ncbi:MAG TPA: hypothetical protein VE326_11785 [Candidatus Binatia bacterium]|nr:hypothetical protein [Candidatus Binatia bacterium]